MPNRVPQNTPIERQLFKIATVLAVCVTGFWLIVGIWAEYNWPVMTIYSLAFGFFSFILWRLIKKKYSMILVNTYFYFSAFLLSLGWFPAGGITGSIIHLFILIYFAGLLTLTPKSYLIFVCVMITIVISLIGIEILYPELVAIYTNEFSRIRDLSIGNILIMVISGFAVFAFKKAYLKDQWQIGELNKTLQEEKVKAENADKTKSQFLTTVSHEMRTPLIGIVGIADLLKETPLNDEQKELISSLSSSSSLLHSLISDVLDLSEIENGKLVLHESTFDVKQEVNQIIEIFKANVRNDTRDLSVTFEHDEKIHPHVKGDLLRLKQVLINLVNNAVKFTDQGFVSVTTKLLYQNNDVINIQFNVEDSGRGIAPHQQEKLFEKFYKTQQSDNSRAPGSGLGLSISKSLVELMNGEIRLVSELGVGSTFTIDIPFKKSTEKSSKPIPTALPKNLKVEDLRVLLVEDVAINQMVIKKMLSNIEVTNIDLAENGLEGFEKATTQVFDLILMDIQMPIMDGIEATKKILSYYTTQNQKAPVIFALTANATKEDIERCLASGMSHFISKPFTQKALLDGVKKHLD